MERLLSGIEFCCVIWQRWVLMVFVMLDVKGEVHECGKDVVVVSLLWWMSAARRWTRVVLHSCREVFLVFVCHRGGLGVDQV
jgi:hypothetical protein